MLEKYYNNYNINNNIKRIDDIIIMSLIELVDNTRTDKNELHGYLELYEQLLSRLKSSATNILEIGIGPFKDPYDPKHNYFPTGNGGSIKLWADYFSNATIYAVDIIDYDNIYDGIKNNDKIKLFSSSNAYDAQFVKENFIDKDIKFDMLLDDGPHTLESMIKFIQLYSGLINDNGILMIEDIPDVAWFNELLNITPEPLKQYVNCYDVRHIKNRFDSLVFVIDKQDK
jgi:hypothetical protein